MRKQSVMYRNLHALQRAPVMHPAQMGAPPVAGPAQQPTSPAPRESVDFPGFVEVPAFYPCSVILGPAVNDANANSVALRPEMFALRRITFATDADAFPNAIIPGGAGHTVEIQWGDEFTQFLGNRPCLVSALFGDSNGFLDLPGAGILFQGRQSLNVRLRRTWALVPQGGEPGDTRWDICFQGVGLLPARTGGVSGGL